MCCYNSCNNRCGCSQSCCRPSNCCPPKPCPPRCCPNCCSAEECPPCPEAVTLSGFVIGTDGLPVSGMVLHYINSQSGSVVTDINGQYVITLPLCQASSLVTITPDLGIGVIATPASYTVSPFENRNDLNFMLSVV